MRWLNQLYEKLTSYGRLEHFVLLHRADIFWFAVLIGIIVHVYRQTRAMNQDRIDFRNIMQRNYDADKKALQNELRDLTFNTRYRIQALEEKLAKALQPPEANPKPLVQVADGSRSDNLDLSNPL